MLWTTDEEIGSKTSRALIEAEAAKSDAVLVFEPSLPGGALKTSRKGVGQFEMIARGDLGACRARSRQGRQRRFASWRGRSSPSTICRTPRMA